MLVPFRDISEEELLKFFSLFPNPLRFEQVDFASCVAIMYDLVYPLSATHAAVKACALKYWISLYEKRGVS